ncbi:MAG: hypothetical protein JO048_02760 [Methylobacteriaceae bacterium]|nr:hypothetical protein [Methylobacteriaceae bacterium]
MSRPIAFALAVALAASEPGPAVAQAQLDQTSPQRTGPDAPQPPRRATTLDDLFARLAAAKDETEANGVANLIERRFGRSGSDTADLLMERAGIALGAKDAPLAVELLDRVTSLKPDWAEAWSRRATAFYLLDDTAAAVADLREALRREPRHFGAWSALGAIALSNDDKKRALEAFRHALAIHPYLEDAKKAVERLAPEVDGRDL